MASEMKQDRKVTGRRPPVGGALYAFTRGPRQRPYQIGSGGCVACGRTTRGLYKKKVNEEVVNSMWPEIMNKTLEPNHPILV